MRYALAAMRAPQQNREPLCGPLSWLSHVPPTAEAVTFDFFNTLVFHRERVGRGRLLSEYLERSGLDPAPWEHDVLYDVFARHLTDYSPFAPEAEKRAYYSALALRVLTRMGISSTKEQAAGHADALWGILGPSCFALFPDVVETLQALRARGTPLAVISNWQSGLSHFCAELGLDGFFDHVLSSADFGVAKPDPRIFLEACHRLGVQPERTLHVGDTYGDDYIGAESAGLQAVLIDRTNQSAQSGRRVPTLACILDLVTESDHGRAEAT